MQLKPGLGMVDVFTDGTSFERIMQLVVESFIVRVVDLLKVLLCDGFDVVVRSASGFGEAS